MLLFVWGYSNGLFEAVVGLPMGKISHTFMCPGIIPNRTPSLVASISGLAQVVGVLGRLFLLFVLNGGTNGNPNGFTSKSLLMFMPKKIVLLPFLAKPQKSSPSLLLPCRPILSPSDLELKN